MIASRFEKFTASLAQIEAHNSNAESPSSYELGLTEYADMSHHEFMTYFGLWKSEQKTEEDCSATKPTAKLQSGNLQLPEVCF
jgi:hypothetical protein